MTRPIKRAINDSYSFICPNCDARHGEGTEVNREVTIMVCMDCKARAAKFESWKKTPRKTEFQQERGRWTYD